MRVRNRLYDRGFLRVHSLGARTISIGNLTTGGTGKTPLVALTAEIMAESGAKVCILTRGYGRARPRERVVVSDGQTVLADAETGGDEPVELAKRLLGKAVVVADADRVAAARWAREKFGITAFVLDDGFQHRRAKRDLDIVCIDATNPCGNGRLLPVGTLRESFNGLGRADAIVLTRANLVDTTDEIVARLRKRNPTAPIFKAHIHIARLVGLGDLLAGRAGTGGKEAGAFFAFCGLGNSASFPRQLKADGFKVSGHKQFRDHHRYTQADVEVIERESKEAGAAALVTTAKDAVKLAGLRFEMPVFVAIAEVRIDKEVEFRELIANTAG